MHNTQSAQLSDNTQEYLIRYCEILKKMICDMENAETTNSISHNFIVQMIPHHEAAIEMSRNLLRFTTYIPLQCLANDIISDQIQGIEQMKEMLDCCSKCENKDSSLCLYERKNRQITKAMFSKMENITETNSINLNFICQMLPHHKGAVKMAQNALRFDICDSLHEILESIIFTQKRQIKQMEYLYQVLAN